MYYRMTTFSYDPSQEDEVTAIADSVRDELKAISGLQSGCSVRVEDGKSVTIAIYDSEASATAAQPEVQQILSKLASVLIAPPEVQQGPVIWKL